MTKLYFSKLLAAASIFLAVCLASGSAQAGFVGQNITASFEYPDQLGVLGSASGLIANGTVLGPVYNGQFNFTFSDTTVLFNNFVCCQHGSANFNGFHIAGSGLGISNVAINAAGTYDPGFDFSRITFDSDNIFLNMSDIIISPDRHILLDVSFGNSVPEPASLALLAAALAGISFTRRKAKLVG